MQAKNLIKNPGLRYTDSYLVFIAIRTSFIAIPIESMPIPSLLL